MESYVQFLNSYWIQLKQMLKRRNATPTIAIGLFPDPYLRLRIRRHLAGGGIDLMYRIMCEENPTRKLATICEVLEQCHKDDSLDSYDFLSWHSSLEIASTEHGRCNDLGHRDPDLTIGLHPFTSDDKSQSLNAAWVWAMSRNTHNVTWFDLSMWERTLYLRSWGYVMWDKERLDQLEIMQSSPGLYREHAPKARTWNINYYYWQKVTEDLEFRPGWTKLKSVVARYGQFVYSKFDGCTRIGIMVKLLWL